jgi:hypothetical protein
MMAKALTPPIIYHDGRSIYLEWAGYAQRFPFTEGGLSKALAMIPHIASSPGYLSGSSNIADKLLDTRKAKIARKTVTQRATAKITDSQRQSAIGALRRLKIKGEP